MGARHIRRGLYLLARDVWNPSPNLAAPEDWRALPRWWRWWRFEVVEDPPSGRFGEPLITIHLLGHPGRTLSSGKIGDRSRYLALTAVLTRISEPET